MEGLKDGGREGVMEGGKEGVCIIGSEKPGSLYGPVKLLV